MARQRRTFRKDEYVGIRLPKEDRRRFETAAEAGRYDLSDLVWRAALDGLEVMRTRDPRMNEGLKKVGL